MRPRARRTPASTPTSTTPPFTQNSSGILELDRPNQGRLDAVYNAPWGLSAGLQFYVRTGTPTSINGYYNQFYTTELYLAQRGYAGRLPTDYEMNMSLGYNLNVGPVTITPQFYVFQLLNRQTATSIDENFNVNGTFVTDPTSPLYGRPGLHSRWHLPGQLRHRHLLGQRELPQDPDPDGSAAVPVRAQGDVLRRILDSYRRGAASAAPSFWIGLFWIGR